MPEGSSYERARLMTDDDQTRPRTSPFIPSDETDSRISTLTLTKGQLMSGQCLAYMHTFSNSNNASFTVTFIAKRPSPNHNPTHVEAAQMEFLGRRSRQGRACFHQIPIKLHTRAETLEHGLRSSPL